MTRRINPRKVKINQSYTVEEAALLLGRSIPTVRSWIKKGLPVMRGHLSEGHRPLGEFAIHLLGNRWGWFYLSTILDDYSRYIIAWKLCAAVRQPTLTSGVHKPF